MTSIVLAGGKSSRFGWNKALETINGKSLVHCIVDRLSSLSTEIIIVIARGDLEFRISNSEFLKSSTSRAKVVVDIYPDKGPLGGIYTGLVESSCFQAIAVACDMPFLSIPLLDYMAQLSPVFDIVAPRIEDKVEPLCAIYSKNCLAPIHSLLKRNELRINELFNVARVKYIEEAEISRFDPEHLSFFNINTQADLDEARKLAIEKRELFL